MAKREFTVEDEYPYNHSGPVRWIISHMRRYPLYPLVAIGAALANNMAYSGIAVATGRAFDIISSEGFQSGAGLRALALLALTIAGLALTQGLTGLTRNYSIAILGQRMERDSRDELYVSLLGKSQTFHGRQRIGDIMARATNDMRSLNFLFSPGLMLILDSLMALIVPIILIARIDTRLLVVPLLFIVMLAITVYDYNRRLKPVSFNLREQFGVMNAGLAEAISGIDVVKSNVMEGYEWKKFTGDARAYRDYFVKQGEIQAFYLPVLAFTIAWALSLLTGLLQWRAGVITLGQVVAFIGWCHVALPDLHLDLHVQPGADRPGQRAAHPGADQHGDRAGRERAGRGAADPRRSGVRRRDLLLQRPASAQGDQLHRQAGRDDRHRRADRLGQEHADPAHQPYLRRRQRARPGGWRGRARVEHGVFAQPDFDDRARSVPVLEDSGREHRVRAQRRQPG
jgi:hypothetical protein